MSLNIYDAANSQLNKVSISDPEIQVSPLSITENGTYTAPTGTAYSPVTVSVSPNVGTKTITQDGTYIASSDNLDGYSSVVVDTAPHLPSGYTEIDYVECPSTGAAGFEISGYTCAYFDIHETKSMPYQVQNEAAFAGHSSSPFVEFYYDSGMISLYTYSSDANGKDLIGRRSASVNNTYFSRAGLSINNKSGFTVGYYRDDAYLFNGRIYYYRIYRGSNESEGMGMLYNFVPCIQDSTNKVGFYDTVNGNFYSSTTGTEFVAPALSS